MKFLAIMALTAGLLTGSAALAQGAQQTEHVRYALTLIDAGDGTRNSKTGDVITGATTAVRVKVTVSVPRAEGSSRYGSVAAAANPVRLMYRKHSGEATAFEGAISLTRDAPYGKNGNPLTTAYYPMPQIDPATGTPILDPTKLNYAAVTSGAAANVEDYPYAAYVGFGRNHDPMRWESTFLSPVYNITAADFAAKHPMIQSLLMGEGTYEWYAASFYGIGFSRISPIQDIGRAMDFTDIRLWEPIDSDASEADAARVDAVSKNTLGSVFEWKVRAMPEAKADGFGWHIYRGSIGADASGDAGAQLLNPQDEAVAYDNLPQIVSPLYPDGIGSIEFQAKVAVADENGPAQLLVQYQLQGATEWTSLGEALTVGGSFETFTVPFTDAAGAAVALQNARFRILRVTAHSAQGEANTLTMAVRNLLVRSAAPQATFRPPTFDPARPSYYKGVNERAAFETVFTAEGDAIARPRGYSATLNILRRAEGDTTRKKHAAPVEVSFNSADGSATLISSFTHTALETNADGTVNAEEGAFFLGPSGEVTGLLPGVYDLELDYDIYGAFKAGRSVIDEHETVSGTLATYTTEVLDANGSPKTVTRPQLLDLREQETAHDSVSLKVMYRSGTKDESAPYTLNTLTVPLLPSPHEPNRWRVDLSRVLRLEDESAVYAWGYDPKATDPDSTADPIFTENKIAFTVCAVSGKETFWFGQQGTALEGMMPPTTAVVPALTETLVAATEAKAVPLVLDTAGLTTSHVMIEISLPDDLLGQTSATARIAGSYWQDFNTWYAPSGNFTETDFRENVRSRTADFDCTVEADARGEYNVTAGWIPDEGPLAGSTSFTDTFEVGRGDIDNSAFFVSDLTGQAGDFFASWGASSEKAKPSYLRSSDSVYAGADNFNSEYLYLGSSAEVVLNRTSRRQSTEYLADAQIRLRGAGRLEPREDSTSGLTLNGVGKVSFTLGISLPYDISHRALLVAKNDSNLFALNGFGVASGVIMNEPNRTCASSGYSVSYYLDDTQSYPAKRFELRLTQILDFKTGTETPADTVIAELYAWSGSTASRLMLTGTDDKNPVPFRQIGSSIAGRSYALWIRADGRLGVSYLSGTSTAAYSLQFLSQDAVANPGYSRGYTPAFGSAECRPIFSHIRRMVSANDKFTPAVVSPSEAAVVEYESPIYGTSWTLASEDGDAFTKISRNNPDANLAGRVVLRARRADGTSVIDPKFARTNVTGNNVTVTIGAANATLSIEPYDEHCNVFLDNITVSSWCGNDFNRNGPTYVPAHTDAGFYAVNGFAGVGVWIRPESDNQLSVSPAAYSGEQCLLMQRSRQNGSAGLSGEVEIGDILNTGSSLAIYGPYSDTGFGAVSFSYRIPAQNEFTGGAASTVRVMLQYLDDPTYYNNYLGNGVPSGWKNVSAPVELKPTGGEWLTASITPKLNGEELVGTEGTLRLVMVTEDLKDDADPYVYIDDFTVTDNATGTLASWSALNVKLTDTPISQLYWKDRAATPGAVPEEQTFAEKSSLTRAMQFNDVSSGTDTDGDYGTSVLQSPPLANGVGRVTFAARLTETNPKPVRLYIEASTDDNTDEDLLTYKPVTYVDVRNTVYTAYDVDLSKFKTYYTKPGEAAPAGGEAFTAGAVKRIRLRTYLVGEGAASDGFDNSTPNTGRVLIDTLAIADPVQPSLRVESVAFSNVAGGENPDQFVRNSPLSQPVTNAPMLRAMVRLGHMQLLKEDSIRVFLTVRPHNIAEASAPVTRYTSVYEYTDVMGNLVSASEAQPVYAWDTKSLSDWPLESWFDLENGGYYDPETGVVTPPTGLETVELHRPNQALEGNHFYGDLSKCGVKELPANSLVQYVAWAVYRSSETDQWHATQITPSTHTDFPWYFPRNLNREIQKFAGEDANFFSPYYWVYSCLPGEVFINEFDIRNQINVKLKSQAFVEICAPAETDISGWKVNFTTNGGTGFSQDLRWTVADGTPTLKKAQPGAVPEQRKTGSSANRAFYTVFCDKSEYFTRKGGAPAGEVVFNFDTQDYNTSNTENGGIAVRGLEPAHLGYNMASSVHLTRPTGGAEHIVVFSTADQDTIKPDPATTYQIAIDELYKLYRSAYISEGFGSEWYQTFLEGSWTEHAASFGPINLKDASLEQAQAHGRRLTKADYFPSAGESTDYRFDQSLSTFEAVQDVANAAFANSIATVDMGGIWVTRRNAIDTSDTASAATRTQIVGGPLDLTDLCYGTWPIDHNPTKAPRLSEPTAEQLPALAKPILAPNAAAPYTQITPRQINPDQYLVKYTGLAQSVVTSTIEGNKLGSHELSVYDDNADDFVDPRLAGRTSPVTWSLDLTVEKVRLTYSALPFQQVGSVKVRFTDAKSSAPLTVKTAIEAQLTGQTLTSDPDGEGWVTLQVAEGVKSFALIATVTKPGAAAEDRYNVEAVAAFEANPEATAEAVITKVSPIVKFDSTRPEAIGGSALWQPWRGSGFGFDVRYDATKTDGAVFSGVIVTYPSPAALKNQAWKGLESDWTGLSPVDAALSLKGKEYAAAIDLLKSTYGPQHGTRYVEIKTVSDNRAVDTSLIGILGDSYTRTTGEKEPAIPFCVWGVYTYTVQGSTGTEKVSFLMPQAAPAPDNTIFEYPSWYAPKPDRNLENAAYAVPYFYLYSTPPQSAWLNEVNAVAADGSAPYAEVVMPRLRSGILQAMSPTDPESMQTTPEGWSVRRYAKDGSEASDGSGASSVPLDGTSPVATYSESYRYYTVNLGPLASSELSSELSAYVLMRPCGAAEGGVWISADVPGNSAVTPPTALEKNAWLLKPESYVVPGVTDSALEAGSVQLVGKTRVDDEGTPGISSAVSERVTWQFSAETRNKANANGDAEISPDYKPEWNLVTVTSSLRNTVYTGVLCGYQAVPGFLPEETSTATPSTAGAVTVSFSGLDWVYNPTFGTGAKVLSYRPRTNYRFESLTLPPELIGHVMLIGNDKALPPELVAEKVADLLELAADPATRDLVTQTDWLRMGGQDVNGTYRAAAEFTSYTDENGLTVTEPTGVIRFNPDYVVTPAGTTAADEALTFGDQSEYVITLVFIDEPASAQNRIEMAMGQGDVQYGAWLATQTLWAYDTSADPADPAKWKPDAAKGGDTVDKPIWSDENGNVDGNYLNVHGWLHQPVTGDRLGMSAVINPELGLVGGQIGSSVEAVRAALEADASLRPFLVWTLIPRDRVPENLFDRTLPGDAALRSTFLQRWALPNWLGSVPAVADGSTAPLSRLRTLLKSTAAQESGFYCAAGLIPMTYRGYCADDLSLEDDPEDPAALTRAQETLLAFSTMTHEELEAAFANPESGLVRDSETALPYTSAIDMSNEKLWEDGAVLRFAVIIADPKTDRIYDCQALANFSTDALSVYCPWYVPDASANINRVSSSEAYGYSPYAWVYAIEQGGVWLNEIRPFAAAETENGVTKVTMSSAVELAMYASDYTAVDNTYIPKRTLDGWKLQMKYAPMPSADASKEEPIQWQTFDGSTVGLVSWIPYRRIDPNGTDESYYELDYYCATTDVTTGFSTDNTIAFVPYSTENAATFNYLKLANELFPTDLDAILQKDEAYANGIIYAVSLVRNNGVVADEVIFYHNTAKIAGDENLEQVAERVQIAIDSENANHRVAGTVRGVTLTRVPIDSNKSAGSIQFVEWVPDYNNPDETLLDWIIDGSINSFPGANLWNGYTQPKLAYSPALSTYSLLTARILGSDAVLSLAQANGVAAVSGATVKAAYVNGTSYRLAVSDWNRKWFALAEVQKNGQPLRSELSTGTVYSLTSSGQLTSAQQITVDESLLTGDTDYALTFVYTPAAAKLAAGGALNSEDDGFLAWLLDADPDAILAQSAEDGVTAAEKYWLGLDSAAVSAQDVQLAITAVGTHAEPDETLPALAIALRQGDAEISTLTGDGVLVLLGKETMDDAWQYVRRLTPEDINGDKYLILRTPCKFFKAVLLSETQAESYL